MLAVIGVLALDSIFLLGGCVAFGVFCDRSGAQLSQLGTDLVAAIAILVGQRQR
jgi:hypothetical protein